MTTTMERYATPARMTSLGRHAADVNVSGVADSVRAIQGWMMHPFHTHSYGITPPGDTEEQLANRSAEAILDRVLAIDARPLAEPRPPELRTIGNCRHFTTLLTALLRAQGVPARSRCGFGAYFEPDRYVDHWVCEYWDDARGRWVLADAQIDDVQRAALGIEIDTLDLGRDDFWVAGQAWLRCRAGEADAERFGIFDMWGLWFILGNLVRDAAALCKMELLPWDCWGIIDRDLSSLDEDEAALVERVARLTIDPDHDSRELLELYRGRDELRVPSKILTLRPQPGPVDVSRWLPDA